MERTHIVKIKGVYSSPKTIGIGVPQGSILGRLFFILYINDIVNLNIEGQFLLYADDTGIFFKHKDIHTLQRVANMALTKITLVRSQL